MKEPEEPARQPTHPRAWSAAPRTRHLQALFGHSLTPLILLDRNLDFLLVNEAYANNFGKSPDYFVGRNYFELYPSDARVIFEEVVHTKRPFRARARAFDFPGPAGRNVSYWDWDLFPVLDGRGEVEALVLALQDVSDRRSRGDRGLRRLAREVERRVVPRRSALLVIPTGILVQVALFLALDQLESPRQYLGLPGPAASLVAVIAGILAGPTAGALVGLAGGILFAFTLADLGRSVVWPVIVASIVLWVLVALVAGLTSEWVRRRSRDRERLLEQSIQDRDTLMESLRAVGENQRKAAEENARLYRAQAKITEELQQAFLHIPASIGRVRVGHLYRSATEAASVGGDFYDVFEAKSGKIAVMIGDVAGHGIPAARTATLVKDAVHAFTYESLCAEDVLQRTNQLLVDKRSSPFVSLFLGILDPDSGLLRYASAGHPDSLVRRRMGVLEALAAGSPPLGVFPEATWAAQQIELQPHDLLLLHTDGLTEARHNGELFGEARLRSLLAGERLSPEELPGLLLQEVLAFSEGQLQDDVAILTLSIGGSHRESKMGRG